MSPREAQEMATTASKSVDIGTLITKSPDNWDGKAVITGTRVPVMFIASYYDLGMTPEEIAHQKYLSLVQVYAAITYYHANRQEIESDRADYDAESDRLEKEWVQKRAEGSM
jgi:uncharacterized protein (DUF433 family)